MRTKSASTIQDIMKKHKKQMKCKKVLDILNDDTAR